MLITFSGLDGAGKSTLIELLKMELEGQSRRVAVFHMNKDIGVYAYLRFIRDFLLSLGCLRRARGVKSAAKGSKAAEDGKIKSAAWSLRKSVVWSKALRRWVYVIDLCLFFFYRLYLEKLRKRVLIMDRYFYDRLVDVADGRGWLGLKLLKSLTPRPTLPIFLDITPEESFARKGEFSVDYLRRRRALYREILSWDEGTVVISNQHDVNSTLRTLGKVVIKRMAER
jgi:thymidylate kinase